MTYHYTFLEDFNDNVHEEKQPESNIFGTSMLHNFYDKVSKNKQTANVSDIVSEGWTWDIGNFTRQNHPLQLMVDNQCHELLNHPVVRSLIHRKWKKFGFLTYFLSLLIYFIFTLCFTLLLFQVRSPFCRDPVRNDSIETSNSTLICSEINGGVYLLFVLILLSAMIRLSLSTAQALVHARDLLAVISGYIGMM